MSAHRHDQSGVKTLGKERITLFSTSLSGFPFSCALAYFDLQHPVPLKKTLQQKESPVPGTLEGSALHGDGGRESEEKWFTGLAVEVDAANRIFTTLPVVPLEERMPRE